MKIKVLDTHSSLLQYRRQVNICWWRLQDVTYTWNFVRCHSDGLAVAAWHHDGATKVNIQHCEIQQNCTEDVRQEVNLQWWVPHAYEREMEAASHGINEGDGNSKTKTETWGCFVVLAMTGGVWRWHKRRLLPLAPSCSLSNHLRHSSLCQAASQPASHLGRRRNANSFVSSNGRTLGRYRQWQAPFPSHSWHLWTWVKVIGLEDAQGAIIWHLRVSSGVPAGMWWHLARKLAKDEGDIPQLSQIDTIGYPSRISCQKTKEKRTNRDITAPDMTN